MRQEEERLQHEEEKLWLQVEEKVKKELRKSYKLKPKIEEEFLNLCRRNPDRNIPYQTTESIKVHFERLRRFKQSKLLYEMYYIGDRGGMSIFQSN